MKNDYTKSIDWSPVERALQDGTFSGYKIAVIETEKIFRNLLNERIPEKTFDLRLERAREFISALKELEHARAMHSHIMDEAGFDISREDTKEIIAGYWRAISDLQKIDRDAVAPQSGRIFSRITRRHYAIVGVSLFTILIAIFFLGETDMGRRICTLFVTISRVCLFYGIPALALCAVLIAGFLFYRKRKWSSPEE